MAGWDGGGTLSASCTPCIKKCCTSSISATRRSRLHRQIGEREEQAYGDRAREIAAELAVHFERGRDTKRAIQYLQQAGENAQRRSAYQEAITLLTKGLELLNTLPDTPSAPSKSWTCKSPRVAR